MDRRGLTRPQRRDLQFQNLDFGTHGDPNGPKNQQPVSDLVGASPASSTSRRNLADLFAERRSDSGLRLQCFALLALICVNRPIARLTSNEAGMPTLALAACSLPRCFITRCSPV